MNNELADALGKECPDWTTATFVVHDARGKIVGYGAVEKTGDGCALRASASPEGVRLLRSFRPPEGGSETP